MSKAPKSRLVISIVGDKSVGKTSLWLAHWKEQKVTEDIIEHANEVSSEPFEKTIMLLDSKSANIFWNVNTGHDCEFWSQGRATPKGDVFLLCFSIADPSSLTNLQSVWLPLIRAHAANPPLLLVGLKSDLRSASPCSALVSRQQSESVATSIGARAYLECSALTLQGVTTVFQQAAALALNLPSASAPSCHPS